jgi:hypothetical protein
MERTKQEHRHVQQHGKACLKDVLQKRPHFRRRRKKQRLEFESEQQAEQPAPDALYRFVMESPISLRVG